MKWCQFGHKSTGWLSVMQGNTGSRFYLIASTKFLKIDITSLGGKTSTVNALPIYWLCFYITLRHPVALYTYSNLKPLVKGPWAKANYYPPVLRREILFLPASVCLSVCLSVVCPSVTKISQEPVDTMQFPFTGKVPHTRGRTDSIFVEIRFKIANLLQLVYKITFWAITLDWIEILTCKFFCSSIHLALQNIFLILRYQWYWQYYR